MTLTIISLCFTLILSCSKDNDLFYDSVLGKDEVQVDENTDSDIDDSNADEGTSDTTVPVPDPFVDKPNQIVGTFYPTSSSEITDSSRANYKAIIETSFECDNCTFAENLTIEPAGGVINGRGIDLNGAYIINTFKPTFSSTTTFDNAYNKSRLSPETFGADGSDAIEDDNAIGTLIEQSEYAIGQTDAVYIKNQESSYFQITGTGLGRTFDWDMNNSTVRTTSSAKLSHSSANDQGNRYLFQFREISVRITNGEFDGQDLASRCFYLNHVESFDFQNVNVHNYYAPPNAAVRGMAYLVKADDIYKGGQWINCTMANIGAASDGNFNNVPYGFAKGIYFNAATENAAKTIIQGCTFSNIYGDDAEGFSNTHEYQYNYRHASSGLSFVIDNNDFIGCQRRALKVNLSNCEITNNYIESAVNSGRPEEGSGNFQAALIHTFPLHNDQTMHDVNTIGNTVNIVGESTNAAFGINDAKDCLIENNIFKSTRADLDRFITFGVTSTQDGLYEGDLDNTVVFRNNTATNVWIRLAGVYEAVNGGFVFENNTLNMEVNRFMNAWWGVIRLQASGGSSEPYTFKDITVNINQTDNAGGLFGGAFLSLGRSLKNVTFDNVDVNYTGGTLPSTPFARIGTPGFGGNFDSTNLIRNCNIVGASGAGSIGVNGDDDSVRIQDSMGDGSTPLTIDQ